MNSESMPGPHDQVWVAQGLLRSEGRGKGTGSQLFRPKSLPPGSLPRPPVVSDSPPPLLTPVLCSVSCGKLLREPGGSTSTFCLSLTHSEAQQTMAGITLHPEWMSYVARCGLSQVNINMKMSETDMQRN